LRPRIHVPKAVPLEEKIEQMKVKDDLLELLPGLDCCLCGCPSCEVFANDVARGAVASEKCIFLSEERLTELRRLYGPDGSGEPPRP
jgi:Na+-translocating ferredoxin:NAD+ oxidoreductase RNF subunit RnfB